MSYTPTPTRTIAGETVGAIGYGLMNFTWTPKPTSDAQAFEAIKLAIDSGSTFLNAGEFYGQPDPTSGLKLLARFFEAEPTYTDRIFLSVKGSMGITQPLGADGSDEELRRSVENINALLKHRKMDLFQPARVATNRSVEDVMGALLTLRDEGHFKYIGISEVSASTIRRAAAVAPIAAVETEYSPWSLDVEKNGVLAACKELSIPIVAYSPLGRGFLTGTIKCLDDIPEGDHRRHFDRFKPENFENNLVLVSKIKALAEKKGITSAQLILAWIQAQWEGFIPIPGSTRPAGVKESLGALDVSLTAEELKEIRNLVENAGVVGGRYFKAHEAMLAV